MKDKVIVYEKLNLFTFGLSIINRFYFRKQYFISFSPFLKKYFCQLIKKIGLEQIHHLNLLRHGIESGTAQKAIELGGEIVEANPNLAKPFMRYMNDHRTESLIKQLFVQSFHKDAYKSIILEKFIINHKNNFIYYFPTAKNFIIDDITGRETCPHIYLVRWHLVFLNMTSLIKSFSNLCGLISAPFYLFLRLMVNGRIVVRKSKDKISKKIIFFHRFETLLRESTKMYRVMYIFNSGILKIADCVHTCLEKKPLSDEKANYLREEGGETFDYHSQKIYIARIWKRLFIDYYKCFFVSFYALSFNRFSSFYVIRGIIAFIYKVVGIESLLEKIDVKVAFFESEIGLTHSIFTIIANKYNIKTMTMLHGHGGYCQPEHNRSNTVINYYLVPGSYYYKYLQRYSPHVDKFCPVGNHEIEELNSVDLETKKLIDRIKHKLNKLRNSDFKIVGVLASYYWPFFPDRLDWWPLFDEDNARKAFLHYWLPFFKWAGQQDDIFFIFKGKAAFNEYEHPFLKEVMREIPKDRYYQNNNMLVKDVIARSTCTICSDNSSVFYDSLCLDTPAISYALSYNAQQAGYVIDEEYSKYIVTHTPSELITNLGHILNNNLPGEIFEKVRKDHHAEGKLDNQTSLRIKRLITEIIEG